MDQEDYAAAVAVLRQRLLAYAAQVWSVTTLDDEGLRQLVALMVPASTASQQTMADLTAAYFADRVGSAAEAAEGVVNARGVDPDTVYARPVVTARTALARGKSVQAALNAGGRRLENIAGTDLQMAKVRQARASMMDSGRSYYRRTLSGSENCALCTIASTQRYYKADLLPIHPGCDCNVAPLSPGEAVDQVIDPATLETAHGQVAAFAGVADRGGRAPDYRKLIVQHEHGEVGPVLGWHGQNFTSKADLK